MAKIYSLMEAHYIDAFLLSKAENIRYFSGFTGGSDARLLITPDNRYILTDSRYLEQARKECKGWEVREEKPPDIATLLELGRGFKKIGIESDHITYHFYLKLRENLRGELVAMPGFMESIRTVKDEEELGLLRKTAQISDQIFTDICNLLETGLSEKQIANEIAYRLKQKGCEREAFDTIVVSGENAALPHGRPGERLLKNGDMLTLDYGGFFQGYAGDMSRTVAIGKADQSLYDAYHAVLEAQEAGLDMIKAGVSCREVDSVVRNCLASHRLDSYFLHSTGHGIGLEIHEKPVLSSRSDQVLEENMVVTIEPGIYISGWGGIRIEDTVIVKKEGCEIITLSTKELIQI